MSRDKPRDDFNDLNQVLGTARAETRKNALKSISTDELWELHHKIASTLTERIQIEKLKIEKLLEQLDGPNGARQRRPLRPRLSRGSKYRAAASDVDRPR